MDHTTNGVNGQFLMIEASYPSSQGLRALLESSVFMATPSYGICFEFWYHMYGKGMGNLNVYANSLDAVNSTLLWTQNGDKGNFFNFFKMLTYFDTQF